MAVNDTVSSWSEISQGAKDVEKYIGQKQYNLAMMKASQTLELMIGSLLAKNGLKSDGSIAERIGDLYRNRIITRTSADNYTSIRNFGKRAASEGDSNPGRANEAYHLLSQEMYTFANEYSSRRSDRSRLTSRIAKGAGRKVRKSPYTIAGVDPAVVFRLLIPMLIIVFLVAIVLFFFKPEEKQEEETETQMQVTTIATLPETLPTLPETAAPVYTEPVEETSEAAVRKWYTTDTLRVRSQPSTDGGDDTVVGVLEPGTVVEYLGDHDDTWARIKYKGDECYVSRQYLASGDAEQ